MVHIDARDLVSGLLGAMTTLHSYPNAQFCAKHHPHVTKAIQSFCSNTNLVTPSNYAYNGASEHGRHVSIRGHCSPAQFVPQYWCLRQFYDMCQQQDGSKASGGQVFGKNGCQVWEISGGQV